MKQQEFETKLNEVYEGTVKPLNRFVNERAVMVFRCSKCRNAFSNRPSHMVGKEAQRHVCYMPYGDRHGTRLSHVGGRNKAKKNGNTGKTVNELNELISQGISAPSIAGKLGLNRLLVTHCIEEKKVLEQQEQEWQQRERPSEKIVLTGYAGEMKRKRKGLG